MQLFFGIRGIIQQTDIFKMFMQSQMFYWKRKNLTTGKEEVVRVQGGLRECMGGIYEYVFPEECYDEVMSMLANPQDIENSLSHKFNGEKFGFKSWAIRKALGNGIKKCPPWKLIPTHHYVSRQGVEIYLIGVKKDKKLEVKEWNFEQEML